MMRHALFHLICATAICFGAQARAETRAVLIGVSDYLALDADLKGPDNDLALMVEVLGARGGGGMTRRRGVRSLHADT